MLGLHRSLNLIPNVWLKHTCYKLKHSYPSRRWWSILARRRNLTGLWRFKVNIDFLQLAFRSNLPSLAEKQLNRVYQRYSELKEEILTSSRNLFTQSSSLPWLYVENVMKQVKSQQYIMIYLSNYKDGAKNNVERDFLFRVVNTVD